MDGEPDYMSDEFLQSCVNSCGSERPGLIKSRKEQREHDVLKKKLLIKANDSKKDASRTVEEALQTPINSDNKGFLMLEKMGFKPGMGLGKKSSGIVEPIGVNIKQDRHGFGIAEAKARMKREYQRLDKERKDRLENVDEYVTMFSKKQKDREAASDLRKSTRICHQLDIKLGMKEPKEEWFWPDDCLPSEDVKEKNETDESNQLDLSEKLEILTDYLRRTYFYCIWCGVQYADEKDLQDCPGPSRDIH